MRTFKVSIVSVYPGFSFAKSASIAVAVHGFISTYHTSAPSNYRDQEINSCASQLRSWGSATQPSSQPLRARSSGAWRGNAAGLRNCEVKGRGTKPIKPRSLQVHQNAPRGTSKTAGSLPIVKQIPGDCQVFCHCFGKNQTNHLKSSWSFRKGNFRKWTGSASKHPWIS